MFENLDKIDQGLAKYLSLKLAEEEIDKLCTTYSNGAEIRNFNSSQLLTNQTKKNEDTDFNNAINTIDLMTTFRMINREHSS